MIKVTIIGHFAKGKEKLNGQTIKTKIIASELERQYGKGAVKRVDTASGLRFLLLLPFIMLNSLYVSKNIVIMPAHNGVRIIPPVLALMNIFFHRSLHYVVVGGWLDREVKANVILRYALRHFSGIYPETRSMQQRLTALCLPNVIVMPNSKPLTIADIALLPNDNQKPLRVCTFSRVMKEKGIEEAMHAVINCNKKKQKTVVTLDIYGQIEHGEEEWFEDIKRYMPESVSYKGIVNYNDSVSILTGYSALLFPTYYPGECFAGTFLDAFAAGLPNIASDWHDNADIVTHGETGFIFPVHDEKTLTDTLLSIIDNPSLLTDLRQACLLKAKEYQPQQIIKILTSRLA